MSYDARSLTSRCFPGLQDCLRFRVPRSNCICSFLYRHQYVMGSMHVQPNIWSLQEQTLETQMLARILRVSVSLRRQGIRQLNKCGSCSLLMPYAFSSQLAPRSSDDWQACFQIEITACTSRGVICCKETQVVFTVEVDAPKRCSPKAGQAS